MGETRLLQAAAKAVTSSPRKTASDMSNRLGGKYLRGISSLAPHSPLLSGRFDPYMVILNSELGGKVSCLSLGSAR